MNKHRGTTFESWLKEEGFMNDFLTKKDIVQVKNPKTGLYVKIYRAIGKIISYKKSKGPYKNIMIARKRK